MYIVMHKTLSSIYYIPGIVLVIRLQRQVRQCPFYFTFFFFGLLCLFSATPMAHGGSLARGLIGAVAAGLRQSYSNARSKPRLEPIPQFTATPDP